ncbi:MAG: hypothetical protein ABEN55_20830 [Bradymonadaceae bacterium]
MSDREIDPEDLKRSATILESMRQNRRRIGKLEEKKKELLEKNKRLERALQQEAERLEDVYDLPDDLDVRVEFPDEPGEPGRFVPVDAPAGG